MQYQELVLDEQAIIHLYQINGWTSYTKDPSSLITGIEQSLYAYAAYDNDQLVGLIRVVGDGSSIVYIQDILVAPMHQRQGIGTTLMKHVLSKYKDVRQIVLTTIKKEAQQSFYQAMGFVSYESLDLAGFYYKGEDNDA